MGKISFRIITEEPKSFVVVGSQPFARSSERLENTLSCLPVINSLPLIDGDTVIAISPLAVSIVVLDFNEEESYGMVMTASV